MNLRTFLLRILLGVGRSDDDRASLLGDLEEEHNSRRARGRGRLAGTLANLFDLDRLVIDKTGVKDRFAIHLDVETEPEGAPAAAAINALEQQLGLTLVSTTGRRSWVQIEGIERPSLR